MPELNQIPTAKNVDDFVSEMLRFLFMIEQQYELQFSIAEIENAILGIGDIYNVEDVLYTTQACLCKNEKECEIYESQFCQHFLAYTKEKYKNEHQPKDKKSQKNAPKNPNITAKKAEQNLIQSRDRVQELNRRKLALSEQLTAALSSVNILGERAAAAESQYNRDKAEFKKLRDINRVSKDPYKEASSITKEVIQQCNSENTPLFPYFGEEKSSFLQCLENISPESLKKAQQLTMKAAAKARNNGNTKAFSKLVSVAFKLNNAVAAINKASNQANKSDDLAEQKKNLAKEAEEVKAIKAELKKAKSDVASVQEASDAAERETEAEKLKTITNEKKYKQAVVYERWKQDNEKSLLIQKDKSVYHRETFINGHRSVQTREDVERVLQEPIESLSKSDMDILQTYIRTNARVFRQKLRDNQKTSAHKNIDVRQTIRHAVRTGGDIAKLYWQKPKKSKASVVILTDISGSCRQASSLSLSFMAAMGEVFPGGCHKFVFVNKLYSADDYFSQYPYDEAISHISQDVQTKGVYSDYGTPIWQLTDNYSGYITKDTTVLLIGDARSNSYDPHLQEMKWICDRAKKVVLLNPENIYEWNVADSVVSQYERCGVKAVPIPNAEALLDFLQNV